jgi:hypothetical protein
MNMSSWSLHKYILLDIFSAQTICKEREKSACLNMGDTQVEGSAHLRTFVRVDSQGPSEKSPSLTYPDGTHTQQYQSKQFHLVLIADASIPVLGLNNHDL